MKRSNWIRLVSMSGLVADGGSLVMKGENLVRRAGREEWKDRGGMASAPGPFSRRLEVASGGGIVGEIGEKGSEFFKSCVGRPESACSARRGEDRDRMPRYHGLARNRTIGVPKSATVSGGYSGYRSTKLRRLLLSFMAAAFSASASVAADRCGEARAETPDILHLDACRDAELGLDGCGHPESPAGSRRGEGAIRNPASFGAFVECPEVFYAGESMDRRSRDDARDPTDLPERTRRISANASNAPQFVPTRSATEPSLEDTRAEAPMIVGDATFGGYLSNECMTCHRMEGTDEGIPSIERLSTEEFVAALRSYRGKQRPNPVMQMIAGRLTDEEIASLAAYYGQLGKEED